MLATEISRTLLIFQKEGLQWYQHYLTQITSNIESICCISQEEAFIHCIKLGHNNSSCFGQDYHCYHAADILYGPQVSCQLSKYEWSILVFSCLIQRGKKILNLLNRISIVYRINRDKVMCWMHIVVIMASQLLWFISMLTQCFRVKYCNPSHSLYCLRKSIRKCKVIKVKWLHSTQLYPEATLEQLWSHYKGKLSVQCQKRHLVSVRQWARARLFFTGRWASSFTWLTRVNVYIKSWAGKSE